MYNVFLVQWSTDTMYNYVLMFNATGSGLCTSVQPVNCSFIQFGSCDPRILGNLYDPFCDDNNYVRNITRVF